MSVDTGTPESVAPESVPECENWLDLLHAGARSLWPIADQLEGIASALSYTGQSELARKLEVLAERVEQSRALLDRGTGAAVTATLHASTEASNNMLRAAFAVAGIELAHAGES